MHYVSANPLNDDQLLLANDVAALLESLTKAESKLALAVKALEFVQSQAGIADAGDACRAIIKTARAALEKIRGEK